MRWRFDIPSEYQRRRVLRSEYEQWLGTMDVDFLVTLSFPQNTRIENARRFLKHWFAYVDNHYIGRAWSRTSSPERTFGIAFPENIATNLHHHCLIRLPTCARAEPAETTTAVLERAWYRAVPRGSCDVQPIYNIAGAARYVVKQVVRPGYLDHYVFASDFHFRRARRALPSSGGPNASTQSGTPVKDLARPS